MNDFLIYSDGQRLKGIERFFKKPSQAKSFKIDKYKHWIVEVKVVKQKIFVQLSNFEIAILKFSWFQWNYKEECWIKMPAEV